MSSVCNRSFLKAGEEPGSLVALRSCRLVFFFRLDAFLSHLQYKKHINKPITKDDRPMKNVLKSLFMWRLKSVCSTSAGGASVLLKSIDKRQLANKGHFDTKSRQRISDFFGFTTIGSSRPAAWSENKTFCTSIMVLAPLCRENKRRPANKTCI